MDDSIDNELSPLATIRQCSSCQLESQVAARPTWQWFTESASARTQESVARGSEGAAPTHVLVD